MAEEDDSDDRIIEIDGNELYEHFRFVADKGQELLRVDKFLVARLQKSSRNRVQQAAEAGCILVNGKPVKSNYRRANFNFFKYLLRHLKRGIDTAMGPAGLINLTAKFAISPGSVMNSHIIGKGHKICNV